MFKVRGASSFFNHGKLLHKTEISITVRKSMYYTNREFLQQYQKILLMVMTHTQRDKKIKNKKQYTFIPFHAYCRC